MKRRSEQKVIIKRGFIIDRRPSNRRTGFTFVFLGADFSEGKLDVQRRQLAIIGRPLISLIILIAGLLELSKK
jgi:hypothetical protein